MTLKRSSILAAVAIALVVPALAQEGHPLTGTWYGDFTTGGQKRDLMVIMKWDGRNVSGSINPGPDAARLESVVMDITPGKPAPEGQNSTNGIPPVFNVRFEVNMPGGGAAQRTVFEGTIENPVAGNRRITGTWTRGIERGPFQIQRL